MPKCLDALRDRLAMYEASYVRRRVTDRCAAEPLRYIRYAQSRLAVGDVDSAIGALVAAQKQETRCEDVLNLRSIGGLSGSRRRGRR